MQRLVLLSDCDKMEPFLPTTKSVNGLLHAIKVLLHRKYSQNLIEKDENAEVTQLAANSSLPIEAVAVFSGINKSSTLSPPGNIIADKWSDDEFGESEVNGNGNVFRHFH